MGRFILLIFFAFSSSYYSVLVAQNAVPKAQAVNEEDGELRQLANQFYHSLESGNPNEFSKLWSDQSPNNELQSFAKKYVLSRIKRLNILAIKIEGEKAKINIQVERELLAQPEWPSIPTFMGWFDRQTLRCVKEGTIWRVLEQLNTVEDFADELVNAGSSTARNSLLTEHPELVSNELINVLYPGKIELVTQYDFEKAVGLYHLVIQMETQLGHKSQVADLLNALAIQFGSRGDQNQELEYYLKSLEISDQFESNDRSSNNYVRANLGTIYAEQGNYSQALEWFNRGLNPTKPQCWVLRNIGNTYKNMGDYSKALEYFNKCLMIAEKLTPESGRDGEIAGTLAGIGDVYLAQNSFFPALESYEKALKIIDTSKNLYDRGALPSVLNSIAKTYLNQSNPAPALQFVERALSLPRAQTEAPGADLEILPTAGRVYRELGMTERARKVLDQAIAGSEYRRSHAAGGEQNRQQYFEQLVTPYHEMIKLLAGEKKFDEAFAYAERSKARALLDVLHSGRAEINKYITNDEQMRDMELRRKTATLNVALQSAQRNSDQSRIKALESDLEQARLEYEAFQTQLYAVHPELRSSRGELNPINVSETAELLPNPRTALIEFVVTDQKTYLFLITKDLVSQPSLKMYAIEIKRSDLANRVEVYRERLAKGDTDFLQASHELFTLLLGPASAQFENKSSLIIVPDGVLWDLPFQALQSDKQRYLIEDHTIFYAPSFTALREMVKGTGKRTGHISNRLDLLALGNPDNGAKVRERIKNGLMDYALEPLPEAEKQVVALSRLYGLAKSRAYIGAAATEARVTADAPSARVIQFATHGILNSRSPMYSHLVLSQSGNEENEDGLLEAWEIMKLNLHAEMVVLAACETARGHVGAGEGMIGMTWAFFVAGSPTTVASQWKVESTSTTQLMLEFHRNLRASDQGTRISKAKSLQLAAVKLLKNPAYRHPFYWAGFVLLGDGF